MYIYIIKKYTIYSTTKYTTFVYKVYVIKVKYTYIQIQEYFPLRTFLCPLKNNKKKENYIKFPFVL